MSGRIGAQRVDASPRGEQLRQQMWAQSVAETVDRLARIERGEWWAPEQVVRCLRVFVAPEVPR